MRVISLGRDSCAEYVLNFPPTEVPDYSINKISPFFDSALWSETVSWSLEHLLGMDHDEEVQKGEYKYSITFPELPADNIILSVFETLLR